MATYDIIINAIDQTKGTFNKVESGLGAIAGRAASIARSLGPAAAAAGVFAGALKLQGVINDMDKLDETLVNIGVRSSESGIKFQQFRNIMGEAGASADQFDDSLNRLQLAIAKGEAGSGPYAEVLKKLGDSALDANGNLKDTVGITEALAQGVAAGTIDLEDAAKLLGRDVGPAFFNAFKQIEESGMSVTDALAEVGNAAGVIYDPETAAKAASFNDAVGRLGTVLNQLMIDTLTPLIPLLTELAEGALAAAPYVVDALKIAFEVLMAPVHAVIEGFQLLVAGVEAFMNFVNMTIEAVNNFVTKIQELGQTIRDFYESGVEIGGNLVDGMKSGISSAASGAKTAIVDAGQGIADGFTDFFGIQSPSKLFMEYGNNLMEGLAIGVEDSKGLVINELSSIEKQGTSIMERFGNGLNSTLQSAFSDGKIEFSDFRNFALDTLADIASQALNLNTGGSSGMGGLFSGIGTAIGSFFGGFFADGGYLPAGKVGIVGEQGPELVKGPASIFSNEDTMAMMGSGGGTSQPVVINFNINAVDTQTGTEFIVKNRGTITSVVQQAFNSRGKQGII